MQRFAIQAAELIADSLGKPFTVEELSIPQDRTHGDFAFPCFKMAKELRKAPPEIAKDFASKIQSSAHKYLSSFTVASVGPFVNFTVTREAAMNAFLPQILEGADCGSFGKLKPGSRGKWTLEFSSPNIAKPFNIYHLRGTALGAALSRAGVHRGFDVVKINHLGDWGTQYGKLAVAFKLYKNEMPANPTIPDLVNIYVKFHQDLEKDPTLEDQARQAFVNLENNEPEITALWKNCVEIALKEFTATYKRLDIEFDHYWGESFYKDLLKPLVQKLKDQKLLVESEGAWIVPVTDREGREIPPCILEKKDGASIYATRDLAAAIYRHDKFKFDRMTYIVGQEQKLHFQQVFGVLRKMGFEWEKVCEHVATGLYRFKDAKMSTRKGNFVTLDSVLEEAKTKSKELLIARTQDTRTQYQDFPGGYDGFIEETSEAVAIGAVVFHDLSTDPARDVEFDLDRVVSFEGETGPYLQYAYIRCLSILRKAGRDADFNPALIARLTHPAELTLVKQLGLFGTHLDRTLNFAKASQLCNFLIDVSKDFGHFYRECHVMGDDPELTSARLMLVESTRRIMGLGMKILGVPRPSRM
ncbi:MAG: arginine--tRNA ligase [Xanthomonadaceae bacterium]|nr:arginine--tRNA ligase [Xanthomonadaceae bacterium]